ncbi:GIY-YIG nuclease family protein [Flavobacterium sp. NRK F7]|uniref:GIY-YIG nuclease family protein n=1 Tax=Flavobacterium sp. NRK F7 TaxID=2954930 RepID=UPI002091D990|nr:GIY-YIG nuclease family protein [Flavobacterium sp. NRK F7]MCO6163328.1 GIY-YIG nuclease family protein [Flavobacterium sp. NRK F7]
MKFYYVYILRCSDNSLYTGITNDLERRVNEHNDGKLSNAYTFKKRPVKLVWYQEFTEPNQAIYFEKKLKKWSKVKKEALIIGNFDLIQTLAECRNATNSNYNL